MRLVRECSGDGREEVEWKEAVSSRVELGLWSCRGERGQWKDCVGLWYCRSTT